LTPPWKEDIEAAKESDDFIANSIDPICRAHTKSLSFIASKKKSLRMKSRRGDGSGLDSASTDSKNDKPR
jgi:hypothetical protein